MAKNNFYIDRQFGIAIWIDVHRGIVKDCHNGGEQYDKKMNENYAGKPIAFLKKDFEKRMREDGGTFHCVHSNDISNQKQKIVAYESRMKQAGIQMSRHELTEEEKASWKKTWDKNRILMLRGKDKLKIVEERVERVHNFKFKK